MSNRAARAPARTDWSANKAPENYAPNWDVWERIKAGEDPKKIPRFAEQPHFGIWRVKVWKPGTSSMEMRKAPHGYEPIYFYPWERDGTTLVICKLGNHTTWDKFPDVCERWESAKLGDPIEFDEYKHWQIHGKWLTTPKGQSEEVVLQAEDVGQVVEAPAAGRTVESTDNSPPEQTPYDKAVEFIDTKARDIAAWIKSVGKVKNEAELLQAQKYRDTLAKTRISLDKRREEEKAPHLKAGREVDAKFKTLITAVSDLEGSINAAAREFAIAKDERIKREKAEADRIAREQVTKAREAAEAAEIARCRSDNKEAERQDAIAAESAAAATEARAAPAKLAVGSSGRKMAVKMVVTADIKDWAAALAYFADDAKVRELVQSKATAIVKAGGTVPGCKRLETPDI